MQLICGMHRSGTSLVAKLFYSAGADMGDPSTFYAADRWNPNGYYEQRDIIQLNNSLLLGAWGKLAYLFLPGAATVLKRGRAHAELIARLGHLYANKIVKENRFCLTLPAWRANGGDVRKILICLREPATVALSLRQRDKIPIWFSYRLWLTHLTGLLENCAGLGTWFVRYEALLNPTTNYSETMGALHFFGMDLPRQDGQALLDANVMPGLNDAAGELECEYPSAVRALWADLLERHARQSLS
jgi:hypothetical protein